MPRIAYYITAHGYGHGTRSCDILNAISVTDPSISIVVKTDLPAAFMKSRLSPPLQQISGAFDLGLIQKDSIQVNLEASLDALEKLYRNEEELIAQEIDFIRRESVDLLVADIPALPLRAAQEAGIPSIATGNFGWDWIYSDFVHHDPRWETYVEKFRTAYQQTDLLLRQPFAEPMTAFPHQIDLPLLAKSGTPNRTHIAKETGADLCKKWVLLSFTTLNLKAKALQQITALNDYQFFSVEPLKWPNSAIHYIPRSTLPFSDILASVDLVITKPGFGIVSECIANNKPILYSDRENFLEYPILVDAIKRYCRNSFIKRALKNIERAPRPHEKMEQGGSERAAQEILNVLRTSK